MLCAKSDGKSGPNWLDRLRSSNGFPIHQPDLDLERFLSSDSNPITESPPLPESKTSGQAEFPPLQPEKRGKGEVGEEWLDLMSCVLSELFNMEDPRKLRSISARRREKSSRKQPNPRIRVLSGPANDEWSCPATCAAACASPPSADNCRAEKRLVGRTKPRKKREIHASVDPDLAAYSRTEVTVIDTSSPVWRSEKLVFRKGLVWKVRDKKSWNVWRKKRRLGLVKHLAGDREKERPPPIDGRATKENLALQDECSMHCDRREASQEVPAFLDPTPRRRSVFSACWHNSYNVEKPKEK